MPGYKKKGEKENRAQQRRNKKDKRNFNMGEDTDDFNQLNNQLISLGLVLKQIPGDGNCLFRALGDQLEGNPHDHFKHREDVVRYMLDHRDDFEPFVEDDISFDTHIRNLSEPGTFGGNDSIVAFARLHNLTVVIHQLNKPLWQIHGGRDGSPGLKEAHISYHNGDHYNSVRRSGDLNGAGPAGVHLSSICKQNPISKQQKPKSLYLSDESGDESDYENSPNTKNMERLIDEVSRLSGVCDEEEIAEALENNTYNVQAAARELTYGTGMRNKNRSNSIWSEQGTGTRILGTQMNGYERNKPTRNKNLSNKRQKELKKRQARYEKDTRRDEGRDSDLNAAVSNIKTLTI